MTEYQGLEVTLEDNLDQAPARGGLLRVGHTQEHIQAGFQWLQRNPHTDKL